MPGSNSETWGGSVMVWAAISWCSIGPNITLHGLITARGYVGRLGNQVHPKIQMLFQENDAVFQEENASNHTAGTVRHCLNSMKVNFNIFLVQHIHQILI
jgi:hypothetical protein